MVIVAGHLTVAPEDRDSYLAGCAHIVEAARGTTGCLDYAIGADTVDPGRVNIFERWASLAAVHAFRGSGPDGGQQDAIVAASVAEYDVAQQQAVFDEH